MRVRRAEASEISDMFRVRTSVRENLLTVPQMAQRGITPRSLTALLERGKLGAWCIEYDGVLAGFSMAKLEEREIFALFVTPELEGRGIGTSLLDAAVQWLGTMSSDPIRLNTGVDTRAHRFYLGRGWHEVGRDPRDGDVILELDPRGREGRG